MRVEALASGLLRTRASAVSTVGLLRGLALAVSILGLELWTSGSVPWADVLGIVGIAPLAVSAMLALPILMGCAWLGSLLPTGALPPDAIGAGLAMLTWTTATVGYWGFLAWLSWRSVSGPSPRALCFLGGSLVLTAPFWLIATAWIASH
jgi:hypothetical protein